MNIKDFGYIIASEYICADGSRDVSDELQRLIDDHPNRTIFFPDGVYLLSKPVLTPADPCRSVDLQLSNFAIIRAMEGWVHSEAMIRLGGKDPSRDQVTPGSNYGLTGGIIDGRGVARGISIDSGRETYIRNVSIKNTVVGIHFKWGANNGSSDADVYNVNIIGNGAPDSIGVLIEGCDNTLTNMRIDNVFVGVDVRSAGNMLRNIHPVFYVGTPEAEERYLESVGFKLGKDWKNWFDFCYSDQFAVGFSSENAGILHDCFCFWYNPDDTPHIALKCQGPFNGQITNLTIDGALFPGRTNQLADGMELGPHAVIQNVTNGGVLIQDIEAALQGK